MNTYDYFVKRFDIKKSSNGWYRFYSPFTEGDSPSMAINFTINRVICHRQNYKSSIIDFIKRVENLTPQQIKETLQNIHTLTNFKDAKKVVNVDVVKLPDYFYLIGETKAKLHSVAYRYLHSRKIDDSLIIERSIGFCNDGEFAGYIVIPFINNRLEYYVTRNFTGSKKRHKNPEVEKVGIGKTEILYNESALENDFIFLVEGVFDALTCGDYGVASLGWSLSVTQISKIINAPVKTIYVIPDPGFYKKALISVYTLLDYKEIWITKDMDRHQCDINKLGSTNDLHFEKVTLTNYYNEIHPV